MSNVVIGAKGAVSIVRPNGSLCKTGIRISRDGAISAYDSRTRQWVEIPSRIPVRGDGTIVLTVTYE